MNGILRKRCCCIREIETGDRTEKASYQSVRATMIPESRRKALCTIDKFDFSKPEWPSNIVEQWSWAQPQNMLFLASNPGTHKRFLESLNSRLNAL